MTRKWNAGLLAAVGFVLGAAYMGVQTSLLHSVAFISQKPVIADILGGLVGSLILGGAAISRNRFEDSMLK